MCEIGQAFFDQDFFQDLVSALIGTGSALLIFYLTLRADKKKETVKDNEDNQNRIRHFSNLLKTSQKHVDTIISNLNEMVTNYDQDDLEFQQLRFSPSKSFDRLDKLLKNENYFLAYANKFGDSEIKTFNNISSEVDYFNMQIEQLWDMIKLSQKFDYDRKDKFKNDVTLLMNKTAWLTKQPNLLTPDHIEKLNILIKEFYDNFTHGTDLEYFYNFLRKVLTEVLINYTHSAMILELLPQFRDTSNLFIEIKDQNSNHKDDLKQISGELKKTLEVYIKDTENLVH